MEENYQGYNQPEYENDDPRKREQVDPRLPYRHHHPGGDPGCHHGPLLQHSPPAAGRLRPVGHRPRFDPEQLERLDAGFRRPATLQRHPFAPDGIERQRPTR